MPYTYIDDGKIVTVDEMPDHAKMTDEERQAQIDNGDNAGWRSKRDTLLSESDWIVTKATEEGTSVADNWKTYRQALRDLPTHSKWPNLEESDLPTKPS